MAAKKSFRSNLAPFLKCALNVFLAEFDSESLSVKTMGLWEC